MKMALEFRLAISEALTSIAVRETIADEAVERMAIDGRAGIETHRPADARNQKES